MDSKGNQYEAMTWNFSKDSNVTRSTCTTLVDMAFLTSYIVTGVAIFIGNLFTCAVFLSKHQLRRTYMNAFLISLACSDFLMAILVLPGFTLFCKHCPALPFSLSPESKACGVLDGLKDFVFLATVFNVLAITFDRYQAVLQSLRYRSRINKKTVTLILVLVWSVPWPIAYLKHILALADPLILKGKNRSFIYDNVVVFTCIISPMVVLLVVNSLLTREIRGQQAKISVPRNLYLTQQQMEEREQKNENENAMGTTERTRVDKNGVRRDSSEMRCHNYVNDGFQGDDERDENNGINVEELNEHVIGASREDHVIVPSMSLTIASTSRDNGNIKATQINVVNDSFQGNGERDEKDCKLEELEELEDHVTCNASGDHVTVYANDLCRKTLDNNNVGSDTFRAKSNSEDLVIVDAIESNTIDGLSHKFEIQKEGCVGRDDACDIKRTRCEDDVTKEEETVGKSIRLEHLNPYPRRKMACVIQPENNDFLDERFQKEESKEEHLSTGYNNPILDAGSADLLKHAKHNVSQEQDHSERSGIGSNIPSDYLRRKNSLQVALHQDAELDDAKATRTDPQNESSTSFGDSDPSCLKTRKIREANVSSCHPNGAFSNEVTHKSQNEDNKICTKLEYKQDDGVETAVRVKEEKQNDESSGSSTTETKSPQYKRESKKNITFQEQKKSTVRSTESSLIRKQLRKFSRDRKDRNGTRSCLTVALIFVVCWIPRCLYNFFLLFTAPAIIDMYLLEKFSMLLLFMQSLTNPLVYCFYRNDFRQTAKELLRKIIKCGRGNC